MSPLLELNKKDDFKGIVKDIVGIMLILDESAFGLNVTHSKDACCLNNHIYNIVDTFQNCSSIHGHLTVVYSLKHKNFIIFTCRLLLNLHIVCPGWIEATGSQDSPASSLQSWSLTSVTSSESPNEMVYKINFQPRGEPSEGTLLAPFHGEFRIIDIAGFHICSNSAEDLFRSTRCHFANAVFKAFNVHKIDNGKKRTLNPEPEVHYLHCTAMLLQGLQLLAISDSSPSSIPTPLKLVELIHHAKIGGGFSPAFFNPSLTLLFLGHYNLYLGGVLCLWFPWTIWNCWCLGWCHWILCLFDRIFLDPQNVTSWIQFSCHLVPMKTR